MSTLKALILGMLLLMLGSTVCAQTPEWTWAKRAGGTNVDEGVFISMDTAGNSYVTGNFIGTATFGSMSLTSNGTLYRDIFVAKMDAAGTWLWAVKAGGANDERVSSIAVDSSGNAYITGYFTSSPMTFTSSISLLRNGTSSNNDIFVARVNTDGTWAWATKNSSGSQTDNGNAITLDSANNVFVTGSFYSTITFGTPVVASLTSTGYSDAFVAKLNTDGAWQWAVKADGATLDSGFGVTTDDSGNVFVCGCFNSTSLTFGNLPALINTAGSKELFVAKVSSGGIWSWARRAGGTGEDSASSIVSDGSAYLYLTGSFDSPAITFAAGISITRNGSSANNDIFVAKLADNGNWSWARNAGGTGYDCGWDLDLDSSANVYLTGQFTGPATFGNTTLSSPEASSLDGFAAKLDASGTWQWAKRAGGAGIDNSKGITVDCNGNAYIAGNYEGSVSFSETTLANAGYSDVFVAKLGNIPLIMLPMGINGPYPANSTQTINWTACGISSVQLEYSLDGGDSWAVIDTVAATPGTYAWVLPNVTCYEVKVRISDAQNGNISVESPAEFAIIIPPSAPEEINVGMSPASPDVFVLSWIPVCTDVDGNEITPSGYRIYISNVLSDNLADFTLLATITDGSCSYAHQVESLNKVFYKIVAFRE